MTETLLDLREGLQVLFDKGGPAMVALAVLSVLVLAVFLARLLALLLSGSRQAAARLRPAAEAARDTRNEAARARLDAMAGREAARLRGGFRFMELAVTAAPLLGLLGTVFGMIDAFRQLEQAGSRVNPSQLAGGIWEALLTTAAGMVVALVALACLTVLEALVERRGSQVEQAVNAVLAGSR